MVFTGSIYIAGCRSFETIRIHMGGQVFDVEKEERIGKLFLETKQPTQIPRCSKTVIMQSN